MKTTKLGKPICVGLGTRDRQCRRVGVWRFQYRSHGKPAFVYFCEQCALLHGYIVCKQSLEHVEG